MLLLFIIIALGVKRKSEKLDDGDADADGLTSANEDLDTVEDTELTTVWEAAHATASLIRITLSFNGKATNGC